VVATRRYGFSFAPVAFPVGKGRWKGHNMAELLLDAAASAPSHASTVDTAANVEFRPEPRCYAVIRVPVNDPEFRPKKAGTAMPGSLVRWPTEALVDTARMYNSRPSTREGGRWLVVQQFGNGVYEHGGIDAADLPKSPGDVPWSVRSGLTMAEATTLVGTLNRPILEIARSPRVWHLVVLVPDLMAGATSTGAGTEGGVA
jgi:hypothetical protein